MQTNSIYQLLKVTTKLTKETSSRLLSWQPIGLRYYWIMNEIDQESIVLNGGVSEHSRAPFWNRDGTEPTPRNGGLMFLPFYWISFICIFFFLWLRVDALFVPSSGHPSVRPGRWRFPSLHRDLLFGLTRYRRKKTHLPAVINQVVSSFIQRLIGFCQGCTQFRSCTAASWWVQFDSIYHTIFRFDPVNNKFLVLHLFFT